jgi:hypothetical protein
MTSLFTKETLVPTPVTSTAGITPLGVMVTTLAGEGVGTGVGLGDGTAGVGDGVDGVSPDPQSAAQSARKAATAQKIIFAQGNRRLVSCRRMFVPRITFAS